LIEDDFNVGLMPNLWASLELKFTLVC
jgi:hypothetical protein